MEDTIHQNQSPDRESHFNKESANEASVGSSWRTSVSGENEYKFSVKVGDDILRISSTNLQLVKSAKILLEEHYTCNIR